MGVIADGSRRQVMPDVEDFDRKSKKRTRKNLAVNEINQFAGNRRSTLLLSIFDRNSSGKNPAPDIIVVERSIFVNHHEYLT